MMTGLNSMQENMGSLRVGSEFTECQSSLNPWQANAAATKTGNV